MKVKLDNTISESIDKKYILMQKAMRDASYHALNMVEMDVILANNQIIFVIRNEQ